MINELNEVKQLIIALEKKVDQPRGDNSNLSTLLCEIHSIQARLSNLKKQSENIAELSQKLA